MTTPAARSSRHPALTAAGTLAVAAGAAWLFSLIRQPSVETRTLDRLNPRPPRHDPPSAADIRVI
ncbi:hypothetical protein GCM10011380_09350 [Sphingomonas metalli]|uniref:Uncharacterized protein n=1 Tax=Sphingomonas metalli TaxID=1779358 RepID=A0A916SZR1_9SPHN|nr:hypothetical protein [Sphingomonas metalli]GGB21919.1 hypothetical protein GCM10011380_09350 [Sphingomonas metalli]